MLDLDAVLIQFFIREATKETMGRTIPLIGGYARYLKRVRDLFGRLVSITLQVETPAWRHWPMFLRYNITYWRRVWCCPSAILRPDSQVAVYQENAVSRDYHLWWATYYYSLGRDRLSQEYLQRSCDFLKKLELPRITIVPCPEACLIELYPLVELAILDSSPEAVSDQLIEVYNKVGHLMRDDEQHDPDSVLRHISVLGYVHRTLRHSNSNSNRVWETLEKSLLMEQGDNSGRGAYEQGEKAYDKWAKGKSDSYKKLLASRAPYWLQQALHPGLPGISYYLGLPILLILVVLILNAEHIASHSVGVAAALRAMGISLSQGLLVSFFALVGLSAFAMCGMAGYALATILTGFRQPISTDSKAKSSQIGEPPGHHSCWKVQRAGISLYESQVIKNHLSVNKDGVLDEGVPEPNSIGNTTIGRFSVEGGRCCFVSHAPQGNTWQIICQPSGGNMRVSAIKPGVKNQEMLNDGDRLAYIAPGNSTPLIQLTVVFVK